MKSHHILPAAVLLCTLTAACGETPTAATQAQPGGASYDGGYTMGSGNRSQESGGGYTIGSGNETQDSGGFTMGSGNLEDGSAPEAPGGYTMGSGN